MGELAKERKSSGIVFWVSVLSGRLRNKNSKIRRFPKGAAASCADGCLKIQLSPHFVIVVRQLAREVAEGTLGKEPVHQAGKLQLVALKYY